MICATNCFELEKCETGYRGSVPGCRLHFNFTQHFCDQLAERWQRDEAEVLVSLPSGRVFAANRDGHYAAELTGGILGEHHMIAIFAAPDWHEPDAVALVTVYPDWDGNLRASHVEIALKWGMQLVRRRPLIEVLERRMTNRSQAPGRGGYRVPSPRLR